MTTATTGRWMITSLPGYRTAQLYRDACAVHPDWVHRQLETTSEIELQSVLDQLSAADFIEHGRCEETGIWFEVDAPTSPGPRDEAHHHLT